MGIPFDMYLMGEVTAAGDASVSPRNIQAAEGVAGAGRGHRGEPCPSAVAGGGTGTAGAMLEDGCLRMFDDLEEAIAVYQAVAQVTPSARAPDGFAASGGTR
jgi:hypothetical protein